MIPPEKEEELEKKAYEALQVCVRLMQLSFYDIDYVAKYTNQLQVHDSQALSQFPRVTTMQDEFKHEHQRVLPLQTSLSLRSAAQVCFTSKQMHSIDVDKIDLYWAYLLNPHTCCEQGIEAAMLLLPERTTSMASLMELASIQVSVLTSNITELPVHESQYCPAQ